jgi:hypothetical protein
VWRNGYFAGLDFERSVLPLVRTRYRIKQGVAEMNTVFLAGANLGRPSSSMCISVSFSEVTGAVKEEFVPVGAEFMGSIKSSSSTVRPC